MMKRTIARLLAALTAVIVSASALAQTYPAKPITVYIGLPPGTNVDASMRIIATEMEKKLGQPLVIESRPGANMTIAAKLAVVAPPDGYALFFGPAITIHPLFTRNNAVDALKDLAPVVDLMTSPFYMMVNGKLPATNFKELVAYSKTIPGGLKAGSSVELTDLLQAMMQSRGGLTSRVIPYKGSTEMAVAMLSGDLDFSIGSSLAYLPHLKGGAIRLMFITGPERLPEFPNVPTAVEAGIANFIFNTDFGLFAPRGTPLPIRQQLAAAAETAMRTPTIVEQIRKFGSEPLSSTPQEQQRRLESAIKAWGDAIRETGFKPKG